MSNDPSIKKSKKKKVENDLEVSIVSNDSEIIEENAAEEAQLVIEPDKRIPTVIQMVKDFRVECPLPCRRDTSMSMRLKAGQIIKDKYLIKHLLNNPESPFVIKE
jgi:hypothetical protein